jgi:hypothetical protein
MQRCGCMHRPCSRHDRLIGVIGGP